MAVPPPPAPPGPPESWVATPPAVPFPAAQEITGALAPAPPLPPVLWLPPPPPPPAPEVPVSPDGDPPPPPAELPLAPPPPPPTSARSATPQLSELAHGPVRTSEAPPPPEPPCPLAPPLLPKPPSPAPPPPLNPPPPPACAPVELPPWPPTSISSAAPGETANTAAASPPSPPLPPPCAPNAETVIEFTPDGTVKLCAAPVKEKLHVTVLAASEQPDGNAAAAEPHKRQPPKADDADHRHRPPDTCTADARREPTHDPRCTQTHRHPPPRSRPSLAHNQRPKRNAPAGHKQPSRLARTAEEPGLSAGRSAPGLTRPRRLAYRIGGPLRARSTHLSDYRFRAAGASDTRPSPLAQCHGPRSRGWLLLARMR